MFERVIYNILKSAIDKVTPPSTETNPDVRALKRLLTSPGWQVGEDGGNDEIQKIADAWVSGDAKPCVRVNYPREASQLPCFAIVLGGEDESDRYLNHDAGFYGDAKTFVEEIEAELGRPVEAKVRRFALNYSIFVYTEHPDVTLAYYTFLRGVMMSGEAAALKECLEEPVFGGNDLQPNPQYLPANVYVRQFNIKGNAHVIYAEDLDLGPLAVARGTKVERIYVNDHVTGVDPGVNPYGEGE